MSNLRGWFRVTGAALVRTILPALTALALLWGAPLPAHAGMITFAGTVTAKNATGPLILTAGGTDFYAFMKILGNGTATGTATGFSSISGAVTLAFGNLTLLSAGGGVGGGFENYGADTGAFFDIYQGSLIGASTPDSLHIDIAANGTATGYGTNTMTGPVASAFYQEVLALNGGALNVILNSFQALIITTPRDENTTGDFAISGTISIPDAQPSAVPEPGSLILFGIGGLLLLVRARRRTR